MRSGEGRRLIAVAVRRDQVAMVSFRGTRLADWAVSHKAGKSPGDAAAVVRDWIVQYHPEAVISQNPDAPGRKGPRNIAILAAIARVISDADLLDLLVTRTQRYADAYEEAAAIAVRFPQLQAKLPPKPRIWETEPRALIYFEAMSLALSVLDGSS